MGYALYPHAVCTLLVNCITLLVAFGVVLLVELFADIIMLLILISKDAQLNNQLGQILVLLFIALCFLSHCAKLMLYLLILLFKFGNLFDQEVECLPLVLNAIVRAFLCHFELA